jgi:hypothetical protein
LVSTLIAGKLIDVDTSAMQGIAVTSLVSGVGTWQFSVSGGSTWMVVGTVSASSALLLRSTDRLRFISDAKNGTMGSVIFVGWDQTGATINKQGTKVSAATNGGTTPFSSTSATSSITVSTVNDAPVLTGALNFTTITHTQTTNAGNLVSTLIAGKVTDVDTGAVQGIAVTGLASGNGTWQYSLDSGKTWKVVGVVSPASALLLRSIDKLRFVPNGVIATTASVTFRAWDQSGATLAKQGTKVNPTPNGGTTAYSTALATATLKVT